MSNISVDFPPLDACRLEMRTFVFLTYHLRNSYLYVGETDRYKYFLTLQSGAVDLERHGKDSDFVKNDIYPYGRCGLKHAARIYRSSHLEKTKKAQDMLDLIISSPDTQINFIHSQVGEKAEKERISKQERAQIKANTISLKQLASQVGITSQHLRSILRKNDFEKPGGRWSWPKSQFPLLVKQVKKLIE